MKGQTLRKTQQVRMSAPGVREQVEVVEKEERAVGAIQDAAA